ncbi:major facilitator superfamily domain-containing protein [Xylariales sp. PMI_506]|nr:major facilitator superfamily domain-containing protein [Xylariales sp. PMI_506]
MVVQPQSDEQSNDKLEEKTPKVELSPAEEYATGTRLLPVFVSLNCAVFLVALDMTIIGTAIPKITDEFNGLSMVSWYGSAYFMTYGGFQSSTGKFMRYFPLKTSFLGFILLFELGSLICAVSPNATCFVVGRAVAGIGGAGTSTGALTIVAFAVEPRLRPQLLGLVGAVYGLSSVIGPLLGGAFSNTIGWRWCFYINLPIGGLSALLILVFFRTPPQVRTVQASAREKFLQMDPFGVILVMAGIISFILALEYGGQTASWNSSVVVGLIVGSALIWIVFVAWEIFQGERAMVVPRLFRQRTVWEPSWFQFFFAAGYFVLLYYLPIYFQSVDNSSPVRSGVLNLPLVISLAIGSTFSGVIVTKTGHAAPFQLGGAVLSTIGAGLIYTFDLDTSIGRWIGYQVFYGLAVGLGFQMAINIAQAGAKAEDMSSVTAIVFFLQTIGGAFSISAAQSGFVNRMITTLATTAPTVDPHVVIATGATEIRSVFPSDQVPGILLAYMAGIKVAFATMVGLVGFTCIIGLFVPWQPLHKDTPIESSDSAEV